MKLSISEAARRAGVDRGTIYHKLKKGELSKEIGDDGKPVIELSELARLYPHAVGGSTGGLNTDQQMPTPSNNSVLERENELLRERIDALERDKDDLRSERDKLLDIAQAHTRLLTDQRSGEPAEKPRGLLGRLLGR